jgi:hypothetical protein
VEDSRLRIEEVDPEIHEMGISTAAGIGNRGSVRVQGQETEAGAVSVISEQ